VEHQVYPQRKIRGLCIALLGAAAATGASATEYPSPTHRYMQRGVRLCDMGSFFVGGALKTTPYVTSTPSTFPHTVVVGQMYVSFQVPGSYDAYPVIMVSGGGHTGAALEATPDGREGWGPYALRHGIPTFIVDQSGRGRSGFDATAIHEGKALLMAGDPSGADLIPDMLAFGPDRTWTAWFGHLVEPGTASPTEDILTGELVPHGWRLDDPSTSHDPGVEPQFPIDTSTPYLVPNNLILPGTWGSEPFGPAEFYELDYYRQIVPNSEQTLPTSTCDTCDPQELSPSIFAASQTWTSLNLAELVEQLGKNYGGAVVVTHSQSGPIGHHMVRILRARGALHHLKGLVTVEGTSCSMPAAGISAEDFDEVPYMVLKGDFTETNASCTETVSAIIERREDGLGTAAVEYIKLDEEPDLAEAWPAPLFRPVMSGITHMMMLGSDEGGGYDSSDVMDVILDWSDQHIEKLPKKLSCFGPNPPSRRNK
jgi:hypothetical protein